MKKKLLSALLVLAMMLTMVPTAFAAGTSTQVANGDELKAAIAAGGSIQLTADIKFETATCLHITKSVTLDLNGKAITAVANGGCADGGSATHFIRVMSGSELTIADSSKSKNGSITASYNAESSFNVIDICSGGKLTVMSGTIKNTAGSVAKHGSNSVNVNQNGTFHLQGGTIHGENAGSTSCPVKIDKGVMVMSGGRISATCPNANGIVANRGTITIAGGDITNLEKAGISATGSTVSIQDGTFKGTLSPDWIAAQKYGICDGTITSVGTTAPADYVAAVNDVLYYTGENGADLAVQNAASGQKLVLRKTPTAGIKTVTEFALKSTLTVILENGATFDSAAITLPSNGIVHTKKPEMNTTEYIVEVDPQQAEARVGDVYYTTLPSAFSSEAAKNGGTVTLLKDVIKTRTSGYSFNNACTLDLNGHTISSNQSTSTSSPKYVFKFYGAGTLTITDSSAAKTGAIINTSPYVTRKGYALYVENGTVSVLGGAFKGAPNDLGVAPDGEIELSGGLFTSDPSEYLAAGKAAVASGRTDYPWAVVTATSSIVKPAVGEPAVQTPDAIVDKDAVEAAAKEIDVQGLAAYASTAAQKSDVTKETATKALNGAQIEATGDNTYVYAQAYLQITPKSYTKPAVDGGETVVPELTMDITPMYRLVASTAADPASIAVKGDAGVNTANAVVIPNTVAKELDVAGTVHMVVPMPDGFITEPVPQIIFVQHKNYEYPAEITKDPQGKFVAKFDNPHRFSTFTFTINPVSEAALNNIGYAKLADAIANAKDMEEIVVMKNGLNVPMSGDSRTVTLTNGTAGEITVTVNGKEYTLGTAEGSNSV